MAKKKQYFVPEVDVLRCHSLSNVICASPLEEESSVNNWQEDDSWGSLF